MTPACKKPSTTHAHDSPLVLDGKAPAIADCAVRTRCALRQGSSADALQDCRMPVQGWPAFGNTPLPHVAGLRAAQVHARCAKCQAPPVVMGCYPCLTLCPPDWNIKELCYIAVRRRMHSSLLRAQHIILYALSRIQPPSGLPLPVSQVRAKYQHTAFDGCKQDSKG